jgi:glyoxylase-like metal-dependent hydrolase (beta-lactamase superfamily II)
VVDTGVGGSAEAIQAGLGRLGLDWGAVGHIVITHQHGDHAGSAAAVLEAAPDAVGYAGGPDTPAIDVPRPLTSVGDGDEVFDLTIIATPGHTAGHISVLDEVAGVLVAGDALNTAGGQATGPNPRFSSDMETALASVAKLAGFSFETLLVGHGDPVTSGASDQVAALAGNG